MTNEELMRRYAAGDESVLEELYGNNVGLIKKIAFDAAYSFGCLTYGRYENGGLTSYAEEILSDLEQEGALTLFRKAREKDYDETKAAFTTYIYSYYANATVKAAIVADEDAPFVVADSASEHGFAIVVKEGADDDAIVEWLDENKTAFGNAIASVEAAGNTVELSVKKGFYYFITTTLGTKVTVGNAMDNVDVFDKNEVEPVIPEDDPEDPKGYGKVMIIDGEFVTETSAKIGDSVNYQIKFVATNYNGAGEDAKRIVEYTITDTPSDVTIIENTVEVKVGTVTVSVTPSFNNGVMTIVLPWVDESGENLYESPIDVTVTYTATVDAAAIDGEASNAVEITWEDEDGNEPDEPITPEDDPTISTYEASIKKVDKNDTDKILNAEFKLYDAESEGNEIKVVACKADGEIAGESDKIAYYRVAVNDNEKNKAVTIKAGAEVAIKGLDEATYYLEETLVPDGYNAPDGRFAVAFGTDTLVTIENANGIELPATGGMGTVLFITIGAIVVMAAGIVLTAKKRLYNEG